MQPLCVRMASGSSKGNNHISGTEKRCLGSLAIGARAWITVPSKRWEMEAPPRAPKREVVPESFCGGRQDVVIPSSLRGLDDRDSSGKCEWCTVGGVVLRLCGAARQSSY